MRAAIMRLAFALASLPMADALAAPPPCWPNLTLPISVEMARAPTTVEIGDVVYAASPVGVVWGYTCKAVDGQHFKIIAAGAWENMPRDWLYIADTLLRGTDADRAAAWNKYATASEWDARLKPDLDMVWAMLPNAPPPPPVVAWRVLADPFRTDKKRLVYTVVAGKRGPATSPAQYVDAGAPCDPVTTITEFGSATFMSVLGNPALIARCVKQ
jgi:hypothetical protein